MKNYEADLILLLAELIVGSLLLSLAWDSIGWLLYVITIAVWAVLLVWQIVTPKKNSDAAKARKIKRNITLIMLIPSTLYIGMILWVIVNLFGAI